MRNKEVFIIAISTIFSYLLIFLMDIGCPLKELFDIDCAGCGVTRMILSILKFDFYQAFRFNPCMFILLILFIVYVIYVGVCILLKRKYLKLGFKTCMLLIVVIIGFGILRNISGFEFLKPIIVR